MKGRSEKLLYLDFDGVLHHEACTVLHVNLAFTLFTGVTQSDAEGGGFEGVAPLFLSAASAPPLLRLLQAAM
eukprot:gene52528-64197_t